MAPQLEPREALGQVRHESARDAVALLVQHAGRDRPLAARPKAVPIREARAGWTALQAPDAPDDLIRCEARVLAG